MKKNTIKLLLLTFFLLNSGLFPQTEWTEYTGNPIVPLGSPGTWDDGCVFLPKVIENMDTLKMFYGGTDGPTNTSKPQIGLAWSLDGSSWTKYAGNPVLPKSSSSWDNGGTAPGGIIEDGDTLRMWYYGKSASSATFPSSDPIGYATSVDAINWNRYPNPVLLPGVSGEWDHDIFYPGNVIKEDGVYKMWYSGGTGLWYTLGPISIGYATSADGIHWTKYNDTTTTTAPYQYSDPVLMHGTPGSYDELRAWSAHVLKTANGYEMWYTGVASIQTILYATSPDGIHWTKRSTPVLQASSWAAGTALLTPSVLLDNNIYRMWFSGAVTLDHLYIRIGYAVSPIGLSIAVSSNGYVSPGDTVWISASVYDSTGLYFFAEIESPDGFPVDSIVLLNNGSGTFMNNWIVPTGVNDYFVDLKLALHDTLIFEMNNIGTFTTITSVSGETDFPQTYFLYQNYPNPFNPTTVISWQSPVGSWQTLKVYDVLGREIATLVDEYSPAGSYEVEFDAKGLSSGVYFYQLKAGVFTETKKLILMK